MWRVLLHGFLEVVTWICQNGYLIAIDNAPQKKEEDRGCGGRLRRLSVPFTIVRRQVGRTVNFINIHYHAIFCFCIKGGDFASVWICEIKSPSLSGGETWGKEKICAPY